MGDLFEIETTKGVDKTNLSFINKGIEFIGRTSINNGVQGFIEKLDFEPNDENTFSISQIGSVNCQFRKHKWYASQNIFILRNFDNRFLNSKLIVVGIINNGLQIFKGGYSDYPTKETLKTLKIQLPLKNGEIDFVFMENFIAELEAERLAELEAERLAELEAYLLATGLNDYNLREEEKKALEEYKNLKWSEFKMGDLFEKISTKKLPYKADELPKEMTDKYTLPCLTSSFKNQGLNYFAPKNEATVLKNVISIPSNSDVYRAYFQSNEFTVLSDAYAISWIFDDIKLLPKQYLFTVQCINKVTDLPIYSYKNKLGGWNVVKNKNILLPIKNDKPDYKIMETLISAIQKLVIKDVVLYSEQKINATKQIINKSE